MTKWQHFLHTLGFHDWHKSADRTMAVPVPRCGPHDPTPATREIKVVDLVCCQCGATRVDTWQHWVHGRIW